MMNRKAISIYNLILGFGILGYWIVSIINHSYTEGSIEIGFHITSETIMALLCIVSGFLLLKSIRSGYVLAVAAHSMIVYSVLNAAGYFGEINNNLAVAAFVFLFLVSCVVLFYVIRNVIE